MALFSRKTKDTKAVAPKEANVAAPVMRADLAHVLMNPRITEKATDAAMQSVYVFDVAVSANKKQIAAAVKNAYNVTPRAIHIVTIRPKVVRNMRTGRSGMKSGGKKAYIYLAKGETITIA